jgi:hypothetical protein
LLAFRLCLELGCLHPDQLLQLLTARQFAEWGEFYALDPFGDQRADLRAGIIAATMSNRWRGKSENPLEPLDFCPFKIEPEQTPEQMQRVLRGILEQVTNG